MFIEGHVVTSGFVDDLFRTDQWHFNAFEFRGEFIVESKAIVLGDTLTREGEWGGERCCGVREGVVTCMI